jgi:carbon storage regulator
MLVLSRKTGQKLIINDNIEIVVIETRGEFVRLGIKAPKEVTIYREEIYEEVKKANQQALSDAHASDLDLPMDLLKNKNVPDGAQIAKKFKSSLTKVQKDK